MLADELKSVKDDFSASIKEGKLLYKLASESKGAIVEIGSWKGYSTIWLADGVVWWGYGGARGVAAVWGGLWW